MYGASLFRWLISNGRSLGEASSLKHGHVIAYKLPEDSGGNIFVPVAQDIADAGDLRPRDFRMASLHAGGQVAAGFGYDFNAALDQPVPLPVAFQRFNREITQCLADAGRRLDDVIKPQSDRAPRHQNTGTASASTLARSALWMLSRVMMSAFLPRVRAAVSLTSISSYSPNFPRG